MGFEEEYPLHAASDVGDENGVLNLLEAGIDVDRIGPNGRTPLHYAARNGHVKVAKILLKHGADPNKLTSDGENALHMAISLAWHSRLCPEIVELLIEHGCDVNQPDKTEDWTPLYACTLFKNGDSVAEVLVRRGAKIDGRTVFGQTPLHRAIIESNLGMVKFLLSHGSDINSPSRSHNGQTAYEISRARANKHIPGTTEIFNLLDAHKRKSQGNTNIPDVLDYLAQSRPFGNKKRYQLSEKTNDATFNYVLFPSLESMKRHFQALKTYAEKNPPPSMIEFVLTRLSNSSIGVMPRNLVFGLGWLGSLGSWETEAFQAANEAARLLGEGNCSIGNIDDHILEIYGWEIFVSEGLKRNLLDLNRLLADDDKNCYPPPSAWLRLNSKETKKTKLVSEERIKNPLISDTIKRQNQIQKIKGKKTGNSRYIWAGVGAIVFLIVAPSLFFYFSKTNTEKIDNTPLSEVKINNKSSDNVNKDSQYWINQGNLFYDLEKPYQAIDAYKKALSFDKNNKHVLADLGVMYRKVGLIEEAILSLEKAIEIDPRFYNANFNIGVVYRFDKENYEKAIEYWNKCLEIDLDNEQTEIIKKELLKIQSIIEKETPNNNVKNDISKIVEILSKEYKENNPSSPSSPPDIGNSYKSVHERIESLRVKQ